MKWRKIGRIFEGCSGIPWIKTHGMIPVADHLEGDVFRIYFSPRDGQNRSNTAFVDIDITNPEKFLDISKEPVLACGDLGGFDDSGALACWLVNHNEQKFLFYTGYTVGVTVTFRNFIGLAISQDNGRTFQRYSRAPILGCTEVDPFLAVTPCVIRENGLWRMWYTTATKWVAQPNAEKPKHFYHIKYAESDDGIHWNPTGIVCIDYKSDMEYAIARPSVFKEGDLYKMWFCCRGDRYLLGYAESHDGKTWERNDEKAGLTVSKSGWDSGMIAYPYVFSHNEETYMLYNGNQYGMTGFGLAVLE
jgi:hypothetical protein